jgi:hypothetical protein
MERLCQLENRLDKVANKLNELQTIIKIYEYQTILKMNRKEFNKRITKEILDYLINKYDAGEKEKFKEEIIEILNEKQQYHRLQITKKSKSYHESCDFYFFPDNERNTSVLTSIDKILHHCDFECLDQNITVDLYIGDRSYISSLEEYEEDYHGSKNKFFISDNKEFDLDKTIELVKTVKEHSQDYQRRILEKPTLILIKEEILSLCIQ